MNHLTRNVMAAALGAVLVNFGKTYFTGALPDYWLFALGALFVLVTLFLPKGILGLVDQLTHKRAKPPVETPIVPEEQIPAMPEQA